MHLKQLISSENFNEINSFVFDSNFNILINKDNNGITGLYLSHTENYSLEQLDKIRSEVNGTTFSLSSKSNLNCTITLYTNECESIKLLGNGNLDGEIFSDDLTISNKGNGDINLNIKSKKFILKNNGTGDFRGIINSEIADLKSKGTGDISIKGKINNLNITQSGTGNISSEEVQTDYLLLSAMGIGDINARSNYSVVANVSGITNVNILGTPTIIDIKCTGMGSVIMPNKNLFNIKNYKENSESYPSYGGYVNIENDYIYENTPYYYPDQENNTEINKDTEKKEPEPVKETVDIKQKLRDRIKKML